MGFLQSLQDTLTSKNEEVVEWLKRISIILIIEQSAVTKVWGFDSDTLTQNDATVSDHVKEVLSRKSLTMCIVLIN